MSDVLPTVSPATTATSEGEQTRQKQGPEEVLTKSSPPEPEKPDQYKNPLADKAQQARQMLRNGAELGHKIEYKPIPRFHTETSSSSHRPPVHKPAVPENYRKLSQERLFQQSNMRDSPVYRHIQQRSLPQLPRDGSPRHGETLSREHLGRLFRMRHHVEDKPNIRTIIRHEISHRRETLQKMKRGGDETAGSAFQKTEGLFSNQKGEILGKLAGRGEENPFESSLKEAVSGKKVVPGLPEGKKANFLSKLASDWQKLFGNMAKMGMSETAMKRNISQLVDALFRGFYRQMANQKGVTLVSDLHFLAEGGAFPGKVIADKFARILVDNPDLLSFLEKMSPGDPLPQELLSKLGDELNYTQMTNVPDVATTAARDAARDAALAQLKNPANLLAMAKLEQALREERSRVNRDDKEGGKKPWAEDKGEDEANLTGAPPYFLWGDPRWQREARLGRPKLWLYFTYIVAGTLAGILGYVLFKYLH